jgi:hypothetical protein
MCKPYFHLIKLSFEVYNCLVSFLFAAIQYWNFFLREKSCDICPRVALGIHSVVLHNYKKSNL